LPRRIEKPASREVQLKPDATSGGVAVRARKEPAGAVGRRQRLIGGLLALTLSIVAYVNVFDNPFVYDDYDTVVSNPSLVDVSNVVFVLVHSPFRPVVNVSYALDRLIWGFWAPGFHLTNVLLHALVVGLLYAFILRALSDTRARVSGGELDWRDPGRFDAWAACTAATLFGVHPLMSEAVAYISGRSELLVGVFFFCALLCGRAAIVAPLSPNVDRRRPRLVRSTIGTVVFGVLALFSKESGAMLPFVLCMYDLMVVPGPPEGRRWRLTHVFLPSFAVLAIVGLVRFLFFPLPPSATGASPLFSLLTQSIVIWRYFGLMVWPVGQSIMHGVHYVTTLTDPKGWMALTAIVLLIAASVKLRRLAPLVPFGVLWFFAVAAPSSSIVALREGMAEHRVYLATAGIAIAVARPGMMLFAALSRGRVGVPDSYASALVLLVALFTTLTLARNQVWSSPVHLWAEAVERSPGMWEPHYALGDVLRQRGRCVDAIPHYRVVVRLRPLNKDALTNLGICLAQTGQLQEAERAFKRTIDLDPAFVRAYTNLGALEIVAGKIDAARDHYRKALEVEPRNVLARLQLARLYETHYQDYGAAANLCAEVMALAPATPGVIECVERNQKLAAGGNGGR
jgi:cytochrome c-type biogenesis protein CcmH/NrfG